MDVIALDDIDPGNLFLEKSAGNIRIRIDGGKLGLSQRKLINTFHYFAKDHMLLRETHVVPLTKILHMANYNSNDREFIKNQSRELASRIVEWDYLGESDQKKQWGVSAFLSEVVFHSNGMVMYTYPPTIRKLYASQGKKGDLSMQIQRLFNSTYAHALWENCILYVNNLETEQFLVADLKVLLGVNDEECPSYKEFRFFNRNIIQPAVVEVNAISELIITPVFHKQSRVVTHVSFNITKKAQADLQFDAVNNQDSLQDRLVGFGCTETEALRILEEHDAHYIEGNLNYVEEKVLSSKISTNPVGYLLKAFKYDYRPKQPEVLRKANELKEKEKQLKAVNDRELSSKKAQETSQADKLRSDLKSRYENLNEEEKVDVQESFRDSIKSLPIFMNAYKKSGLRSKLVMTTFIQFLADYWSTVLEK